MRAHVGQAAQCPSGIAREEQRLVEQAGQKLARRERAWRSDIGEIADPLPGAGEDPLTRQRIRGLVAVKGALNRRGDGDVPVDRIDHACMLPATADRSSQTAGLLPDARHDSPRCGHAADMRLRPES